MNRRKPLLIAAITALLLPSAVMANPIMSGEENEWFKKLTILPFQKKKPELENVKIYNWDSKPQSVLHETTNQAKPQVQPSQIYKYDPNGKGNAPLNTILIDPIVPVQSISTPKVGSKQNSSQTKVMKPVRKLENLTKNTIERRFDNEI